MHIVVDSVFDVDYVSDVCNESDVCACTSVCLSTCVCAPARLSVPLSVLVSDDVFLIVLVCVSDKCVACDKRGGPDVRDARDGALCA